MSRPTQKRVFAQPAACFSPRGPSDGATAGLRGHSAAGTHRRGTQNRDTQSRDRQGAVPSTGVAPGVSPECGVAPGVSPVSAVAQTASPESGVAPGVSPVSRLFNAGRIGRSPAVLATQGNGAGGTEVAMASDSLSGPPLLLVHGLQYIDERAVMRDHEGDGQDYYYLLQELYSVSGLATSNGLRAEHAVYDAYGQATLYAWPSADVNGDGEVNILDQVLVRDADPDSPLYDVNLDGGVDVLDLVVVRNQLNTSAVATTTSNVDNPYYFTGRLTDTLHASDLLVANDPHFRRLQDNRNRTYDPKHGRWLQRDPLQYMDAHNLYLYCLNNPGLLVDPEGKLWLQLGIGVAGALTEGVLIYLEEGGAAFSDPKVYLHIALQGASWGFGAASVKAGVKTFRLCRASGRLSAEIRKKDMIAWTYARWEGISISKLIEVAKNTHVSAGGRAALSGVADQGKHFALSVGAQALGEWSSYDHRAVDTGENFFWFTVRTIQEVSETLRATIDFDIENDQVIRQDARSYYEYRERQYSE